nr:MULTISPECIES: succinate dehydrogenase assembly factor 4 [Thermomonas]
MSIIGQSSPAPESAPAQAAPGTPAPQPVPDVPPAAEEHGGRGGLDPTRYGDWEKNGRCIDF